ncbi:protein kinase [Streptomyces sp. NPDC002580]|uniref:serine/threonine-protein kinase n=1 Tax=Streptomyces sp. NPDC002580 TaxID=3364653 RepID=UPI0036CBDFFE
MGEVFAGRYELVDPIGRGGVGAVWRAWDHRRRRYVAAKVLQQSDAHALLRFVREQALRIDHPHVLAPASWAADDDKVLFTMDLVAGGSLVHLVNDYGPLPPLFVCTLIDQLLAGLAAVHAEGVVHRDIKPANVLLEATGTGRPRLRLSDFGIAMRLGEPRLTETNYVVGTPGYFAPEQLLGSEPDFPADLFATGLVTLYLLEGAKPDAKALIEYFAEHGTPSAPRGIPEPLWQVVAMLLQPDPDARFRTATGARKALAAAVELLPEPGPDDELIEVFDQIGPLPEGFGPTGPSEGGNASAIGPRAVSSRRRPETGTGTGTGTGTDTRTDTGVDTRTGTGIEPRAGTESGAAVESGAATDSASLSASRPPSRSTSGSGSDSRPHPDSGSSPVPDPRSEVFRAPDPSPAPDEGSSSGQVPGVGKPVPGNVRPGPGAEAESADLGAERGLPEFRPGDEGQAPAQGAVDPRPAEDGVQPRPAPVDARVQPAPEPPRPLAAPAAVQPLPASEDAGLLTAPGATSPDPVVSRTSARPSSMSDTGSFHLPPPRSETGTGSPRRPRAEAPPRLPPYPPEQRHHQAAPETPPNPPASVPPPAPLYPPPFDPTPTPTTAATPVPARAAAPHRLPAPSPDVQQHTYAPTAAYTARSVQNPPRTTVVTKGRRRRARPRPGPSAKIAVPMLLVALACFAVGFWALSQV